MNIDSVTIDVNYREGSWGFKKFTIHFHRDKNLFWFYNKDGEDLVFKTLPEAIEFLEINFI